MVAEVATDGVAIEIEKRTDQALTSKGQDTPEAGGAGAAQEPE